MRVKFAVIYRTHIQESPRWRHKYRPAGDPWSHHKGLKHMSREADSEAHKAVMDTRENQNHRAITWAWSRETELGTQHAYFYLLTQSQVLSPDCLSHDPLLSVPGFSQGPERHGVFSVATLLGWPRKSSSGFSGNHCELVYTAAQASTHKRAAVLGPSSPKSHLSS